MFQFWVDKISIPFTSYRNAKAFLLDKKPRIAHHFAVIEGGSWWKENASKHTREISERRNESHKIRYPGKVWTRTNKWAINKTIFVHGVPTSSCRYISGSIQSIQLLTRSQLRRTKAIWHCRWPISLFNATSWLMTVCRKIDSVNPLLTQTAYAASLPRYPCPVRRLCLFCFIFYCTRVRITNATYEFCVIRSKTNLLWSKW